MQNSFTPYERAGSPHEKCETCRGDARTWRCLWRLLQKLCLSGVESLPSECRALRVRTIIGSVRVSGTQTPSTDSEVRRPLGSQEEKLFNKIQSIICTLVLDKIFKWHLTLPPLHILTFSTKKETCLQHPCHPSSKVSSLNSWRGNIVWDSYNITAHLLFDCVQC